MADESDGVREAHPSDASITVSTEEIKLGDPLPDTIYVTSGELLAAYQAHSVLSKDEPYTECRIKYRAKT